MKALLPSNNNTMKMVLGSPIFTVSDVACLSFRYKFSTSDIKLSVTIVPENGNSSYIYQSNDLRYFVWHSVAIPLPSIGKVSVKFIASTMESTQIFPSIILDDVMLDYSQCPDLANGKWQFVQVAMINPCTFYNFTFCMELHGQSV